MEERYIFFVWLPNIEARLHQVSAALEDAIPKEKSRKRDQTKREKKDTCSHNNSLSRHKQTSSCLTDINPSTFRFFLFITTLIKTFFRVNYHEIRPISQFHSRVLYYEAGLGGYQDNIRVGVGNIILCY